MIVLRRAKDLVAEREARRRQVAFSADETGLARAATVIEAANANGASEVTDQTFSPRVVSLLQAAGYRVTFQKAQGTGDVDSHRIEWGTKAARKGAAKITQAQRLALADVAAGMPYGACRKASEFTRRHLVLDRLIDRRLILSRPGPPVSLYLTDAGLAAMADVKTGEGDEQATTSTAGA